MGILSSAGVSVKDAPKDPYGFGTEYWPIQVLTVGEVKKTNSGDKIGMMLTWTCIHPDFAKMEKLGNGNWVQLPVPEDLQGVMPWDPESSEARQVLFNLTKIFSALGFSADEMDDIEPHDLIGRTCLGKIFPKQNDEGFWQFHIPASQLKAMPAEGMEGLSEFTPKQSQQSGMSDIEQALARDAGAE